MVEDAIRSDLPVAAFDGVPMGLAIEMLAKEWQVLLSKPLTTYSAHTAELIELTHRRLYQNKVRITDYERMVDYFSQWLQRTQERTQLESTSASLIKRYQSQIVTYQVCLAKAHFSARLTAYRLNQLIALNS